MTNIQAIDLLKGLEQILDDYCELNDEGKTAFQMAITSLEVFGISEQLPSAEPKWAKKVEQMRIKAEGMPCVKNPLAWALYQVWKEYDRGEQE